VTCFPYHLGVVDRLAGAPEHGHLDGPALAARFNSLGGVVCTRDAVYVCDRANGALRCIRQEKVETCTRNLSSPQYLAVNSDQTKLYVTTKTGIYVHGMASHR
jgi:hypothetical protein